MYMLVLNDLTSPNGVGANFVASSDTGCSNRHAWRHLSMLCESADVCVTRKIQSRQAFFFGENSDFWCALKRRLEHLHFFFSTHSNMKALMTLQAQERPTPVDFQDGDSTPFESQDDVESQLNASSTASTDSVVGSQDTDTKLRRLSTIPIDDIVEDSLVWSMPVPMEDRQASILDVCSRRFAFLNILANVVHFSTKRPIKMLICCFLLYMTNSNAFVVLDTILTIHILQVVVKILKDTTRISRPKWRWHFPNAVPRKERCYSFPSGHTTFISSVFYLIALQHPTIPALWFTCGLASVTVAASRITLCVHWVTDVLAAILLTVTIGTAVFVVKPVQRWSSDTKEASVLAITYICYGSTVLVYAVIARWCVKSGHTRDSYQQVIRSNSSYEKAMKVSMFSVIATDAAFYSSIALGLFGCWMLDYMPYPPTNENANGSNGGATRVRLWVVATLGCLAMLKFLDLALSHRRVKEASRVDRLIKVIFYSLAALWMTMGTRWAVST